MIVKKTISQLNVTQLLLMHENADDSTKLHIDDEIKRRSISKVEYEKAQKEFEYVRVHRQISNEQPIPWYLKIGFILVPIIPKTIIDTEPLERDLQKNLSRSNANQRKQEYLFRKIGIIFYLILIISFITYTNLNKQNNINVNISNYRTNEEREKFGIPTIPYDWHITKDMARDLWTNETNDDIMHQEKICSKIGEFDRFVNNANKNTRWILEQEFNFKKLKRNISPWEIKLISIKSDNEKYETKSQPISKEQADSVLINWKIKI